MQGTEIIMANKTEIDKKYITTPENPKEGSVPASPSEPKKTANADPVSKADLPAHKAPVSNNIEVSKPKAPLDVGKIEGAAAAASPKPEETNNTQTVKATKDPTPEPVDPRR